MKNYTILRKNGKVRKVGRRRKYVKENKQGKRLILL